MIAEPDYLFRTLHSNIVHFEFSKVIKLKLLPGVLRYQFEKQDALIVQSMNSDNHTYFLVTPRFAPRH